MDKEIYDLCCLVSKLIFEDKVILTEENKDKNTFNDILKRLGDGYENYFGIK